MVIHFIKNGCYLPRTIYLAKNYLKLFKKLLFLEYKLIISTKLRVEMVKQYHEGHLGIENTKSQARKYLVSSDIESFIKSSKLTKKILEKIVSCKIYASKTFILRHPRFQILPFKNQSAETVISPIILVFALFGIPDILLIPYKSERFLEFARIRNFTFF